jgi:hypothetical protein
MIHLYIKLVSSVTLVYKSTKYKTVVVLDRKKNPKSEPMRFPIKNQKKGTHTAQKKTTQQRDDGKGTMMVHSRRRIGFHGH